MTIPHKLAWNNDGNNKINRVSDMSKFNEIVQNGKKHLGNLQL
jgi:hypothetical protein